MSPWKRCPWCLGSVEGHEESRMCFECGAATTKGGRWWSRGAKDWEQVPAGCLVVRAMGSKA